MVITTRLKVLCALALGVGAFVLLTDAPAPAPGVVGPRAAQSAHKPAKRNVSSTPVAGGTAAARPISTRVTDASSAAALFGSHSWYVAPPAPPPPPPAPPVAAMAPPPPSAPPLPFAAMGSYARGTDSTVYFLTRGDRVFDVRVGDTIDNLYSVDGAENGQLKLTYKPLNIQQSLAIGDSK